MKIPTWTCMSTYCNYLKLHGMKRTFKDINRTIHNSLHEPTCLGRMSANLRSVVTIVIHLIIAPRKYNCVCKRSSIRGYGRLQATMINSWRLQRQGAFRIRLWNRVLWIDMWFGGWYRRTPSPQPAQAYTSTLNFPQFRTHNVLSYATEAVLQHTHTSSGEREGLSSLSYLRGQATLELPLLIWIRSHPVRCSLNSVYKWSCILEP